MARSEKNKMEVHICGSQIYVQGAKLPRRGKVNMLIDVVPDEKDGIHYTVHVPVGTDKLMMMAVRDLPYWRGLKASQCVATFDREVHTGQRR
jgi:hypothetical protein